MRDAEMDRLERDAFRKFHEDGLFDIYLGVLLAAMPTASLLSTVLASEALTLLVYGAAIMAIVGVYALLRRRVVRPRLGSFVPAAQRKRKIRLVRLVLAASVVLGLLLWWAFAAAAGGEDTLRAFMPAIWFANAMLVFGAMAYFLDVPRFYIYGVLFGLPLALEAVLGTYFSVDLPLVVLFGVPALLMIAVGSVKLVHFLRDYPVRASEVDCGGA
jgi:hypothetical protein